MAKQPIQMPGEQKIDPATGLPPVLNNAGTEDPNDLARARERHLAAVAQASTGGTAELAAPPPIDTGPALQERTIGGARVQVRVPEIRHNTQVQTFGPELGYPRGTLLRRDGTPIEGDEKPYGVVGDILTEAGLLIHRLIPIEDEAA